MNAPTSSTPRKRRVTPETMAEAGIALTLPKVTVKLFGEEDEGALVLGGYLREAYQEAEAFSQLLQQRVRGAGFFKTLLLRRLGSSMEAGRRTVRKLLGEDPDIPDDEDEDDAEEDMPPQVGRPPQGASDFKNFTDAELNSLRRCLGLLQQGGNRDPKLEALIGYLLGTAQGVTERWLDLGCILFSQYYDTVRWVGDELAKRPEFAGTDIGLEDLEVRWDADFDLVAAANLRVQVIDHRLVFLDQLGRVVLGQDVHAVHAGLRLRGSLAVLRRLGGFIGPLAACRQQEDGEAQGQ